MIDSKLRIILIITISSIMITIISLVKNKKINIRYSLLWFFSCLGTLIVCIFPQIADFFASLIGIHSVVNFVFVLGGLFFILILIYLTTVVSKSTNQIYTLVQENAILENEIRVLSDKLNQAKKGK